MRGGAEERNIKRERAGGERDDFGFEPGKEIGGGANIGVVWDVDGEVGVLEPHFTAGFIKDEARGVANEVGGSGIGGAIEEKWIGRELNGNEGGAVCRNCHVGDGGGEG